MYVKCYQPGGMSWRCVLHIWWSAHRFLFSKEWKKEILEQQNKDKKWLLDSGVQTHIKVLQLGFGRGLVHKLQNSAQITNVDAPLVQGLGQCGSIHGQSAVVQTVFNLVIKTHIYDFKLRYTTRILKPLYDFDPWGVSLTSDGIWQDTRKKAASLRSCFCFWTSSALSSGKRTPSPTTHAHIFSAIHSVLSLPSTFGAKCAKNDYK